MARIQNIMLKVGGKFFRGSRRLLLDIAEGIAPLWQKLMARIKKIHQVQRIRLSASTDFTPLPNHAFQRFTPRN